jgi:hypothetical protein
MRRTINIRPTGPFVPPTLKAQLAASELALYGPKKKVRSRPAQNGARSGHEAVADDRRGDAGALGAAGAGLMARSTKAPRRSGPPRPAKPPPYRPARPRAAPEGGVPRGPLPRGKASKRPRRRNPRPDRDRSCAASVKMTSAKKWQLLIALQQEKPDELPAPSAAEPPETIAAEPPDTINEVDRAAIALLKLACQRQ